MNGHDKKGGRPSGKDGAAGAKRPRSDNQNQFQNRGKRSGGPDRAYGRGAEKDSRHQDSPPRARKADRGAPRRSNFEQDADERRGRDGDRGGFQKRDGDRGGYQKRDGDRGGYQKRDGDRGGFQKRDGDRGGYQKRDGDRGGFQKREGDRGGYQKRDGDRGGYQKRDGDRGGFQKRDGDRGGYQKRDGDRGGFQKRDGDRGRGRDGNREYRKAWHDDNWHWLYGRHSVLPALQNPKRHIDKLLATEEFAEENKALARHSRLQVVERRILERTLRDYDIYDVPHGGIAALVSTLPEPDLTDLLQPEGPSIVVALDSVTDPHNAGAMLRSAAAFGARAVIASDRRSAPVTAALAKAASGALETVPYVRPVNLTRTLEQLKEWGYWLVGLDGTSEQTLADTAKFDRVVLVMGSEGKGLRRLTQESCDMLVKIPMTDAMESLNVSNAAAISLYEMYRNQQDKKE